MKTTKNKAVSSTWSHKQLISLKNGTLETEGPKFLLTFCCDFSDFSAKTKFEVNA